MLLWILFFLFCSLFYTFKWQQLNNINVKMFRKCYVQNQQHWTNASVNHTYKHESLPWHIRTRVTRSRTALTSVDITWRQRGLAEPIRRECADGTRCHSVHVPPGGRVSQHTYICVWWLASAYVRSCSTYYVGSICLFMYVVCPYIYNDLNNRIYIYIRLYFSCYDGRIYFKLKLA